jgi:phage shock protein PspC (stress-responsive transcriptional regulator)
MTAQHSVPRRLHRRSDERVIAGVASGLGDYFNVDPLLIRIALVASLVFGGLGIFLYAAAWLLVPDDSSGQSVMERFLGGDRSGLPGGVVVVIGVIVALSAIGVIFGSPGDGGALAFAVAVVAVGALLLQRRGPSDAAVAPTSASGAPPTDAVAAPAAPVVRRQRRPASPLGWYALGAALIAVGGMALAGSTWGIAFTPGTYAGVVLGVIGLALLVGAWFGHARFLIVIGLLLLPVAWAASLVDVPIQGAWGQQLFAPTAASEVRDSYHLAGGHLELDLSRVEASSSDPVTVDASIAFGQLTVVVPDDASVEVDASLGGGTLRLLNEPFDNGTYLANHVVAGSGDPDFILDLDGGIGSIRVETRTREDR